MHSNLYAYHKQNFAEAMEYTKSIYFEHNALVSLYQEATQCCRFKYATPEYVRGYKGVGLNQNVTDYSKWNARVEPLAATPNQT